MEYVVVLKSTEFDFTLVFIKSPLTFALDVQLMGIYMLMVTILMLSQ